jgi:hypothetical protein
MSLDNLIKYLIWITLFGLLLFAVYSMLKRIGVM